MDYCSICTTLEKGGLLLLCCSESVACSQWAADTKEKSVYPWTCGSNQSINGPNRGKHIWRFPIGQTTSSEYKKMSSKNDLFFTRNKVEIRSLITTKIRHGFSFRNSCGTKSTALYKRTSSRMELYSKIPVMFPDKNFGKQIQMMWPNYLSQNFWQACYIEMEKNTRL
jgi:hypothetical protein